MTQLIGLQHCEVNYLVLEDLKLVRVTVKGLLNKYELESIVNQLKSVAKGKRYNRLFDFRNCLIQLSVFDLYDFPRSAEVMQHFTNKLIRVAILANKETECHKLKFYETTSGHVGLNIKVFTEQKEATLWASEALNEKTVFLEGKHDRYIRATT